MKEYLVLVLVLIGTALGSQATETNKIVNQVGTAVQSVSDAADSLTVSVGQTVARVDTSRLYKSIYQDMKTGLQAMAESLKVGAEHVYKVMVMQQVVKAVHQLSLGILSIILLILFYLSARGVDFDSYNDSISSVPLLLTATSTGVIGGVLFISTLFQIDVIVMGLVNPEYGAILDIIGVVKGTVGDHGCATCGH
jgi:phosphoribosylformylglycinamidine (FGAM) synthase-like enzyme